MIISEWYVRVLVDNEIYVGWNKRHSNFLFSLKL